MTNQESDLTKEIRRTLKREVPENFLLFCSLRPYVSTEVITNFILTGEIDDYQLQSITQLFNEWEQTKSLLYGVEI